MGFDIVLDRAGCSSVGVLKLTAGEHICHVLEDVCLASEVGRIGPSGLDISATSGTLHATTQRVAWLGNGASNIDNKRSCSIPLQALEEVAMSKSQSAECMLACRGAGSCGHLV
jgi:hypothetical protein